MSNAGQKLFDLINDLVGVDPRNVIVSGELDEASVRNVICDVSALLDSRIAVAPAMED